MTRSQRHLRETAGLGPEDSAGDTWLDERGLTGSDIPDVITTFSVIHGGVLVALAPNPVTFGSTLPQTWAAARAAAFAASNKLIMRDYLIRKAQPRQSLSGVVSGTQTITTQAQANALAGKTIIGNIVVQGSGIQLHDFLLRPDPNVVTLTNGDMATVAVGSIDALLYIDSSAPNCLVNYVVIDGENTVTSGLGGPGFTLGTTVRNVEVKRHGQDGWKPPAGATVEELVIHSPWAWNTSINGAYDGNLTQTRYPHQDCMQILRSGGPYQPITVRNSYLQNNLATPGATSGIIIKPDTSDPITAFSLDNCYLEGGSWMVLIATGIGGSPSGLVFTSNMFGPWGAGFGPWSFPGGTDLTRTGNVLFPENVNIDTLPTGSYTRP